MPIDDRDLERRFGAVRLMDRAGAPEFGALLGRPVRRRRPVAPVAALVAAGVILAVGVARLASQRIRAERDAPSVLTWQSPTDVLLETPGLNLLRGVPTLRSSVLRNPGA
jgi:hypothetical protein